MLEIYSITSYYMAHQFYYLTKNLIELIDSDRINKGYMMIEMGELMEMKERGDIEEALDILRNNLEQGKNLLQKCYKESKQALKDEKEQILLLDGRINYAIKCSRMLIREFQIIYSFYKKSPKSETIKKRCCYLIEIYCRLKAMNGEELKESEDL